MAIKSFKPMTNGTRGMTKLANEEIEKIPNELLSHHIKVLN